jgi:hypothetical protein
MGKKSRPAQQEINTAFGGGPVFNRDGAGFDMPHPECAFWPSDTVDHFPADLPTDPSPQDHSPPFPRGEWGDKTRNTSTKHHRGESIEFGMIREQDLLFSEHVDFLRDNRSDAVGLVPTSSGYNPFHR